MKSLISLITVIALCVVFASLASAQESADNPEATAECGGNYQVPCESGCNSGATPFLDMCFTTDLEGYPVFCGATEGMDACSEDAMRAFWLRSPCESGLTEYQEFCYAVDEHGYPSFCGVAGRASCNLAAQQQFEVDPCMEGLFDVGGICATTVEIQERGFLADKKAAAQRKARNTRIAAARKKRAAEREAQRIKDKAIALALEAKRMLELAAKSAAAKAYFLEEGMSYAAQSKPLLDALATASEKMVVMNIKGRLESITSVRSRGESVSDQDGPLMSVVNDVRETVEFEALEAMAVALGYHSIVLMWSCGASAGFTWISAGITLAEGAAWSPRGGEIALVRELGWSFGGLHAMAACDVSLGAYLPAPRDLKGGAYTLTGDVYSALGVGAAVSWDIGWPGLARIPSEYGQARWLYMWDRKDEVDVSGLSVSIGLGYGANILSALGSDSYVRVIETPDPLVIFRVVDFEKGEVEIRNVGRGVVNLEEYVIVLNNGDPIPVISGQLFGYHRAYGYPAYGESEDDQLDHFRGICNDDYDAGPYDLCLYGDWRVSIPSLSASEGRVALYKSETIVDEIRWSPSGSGVCSSDAKNAWINCGICELDDKVTYEIYTDETVNPTWGANSSDWIARQYDRDGGREYGFPYVQGGDKDKRCGTALLPMYRINDNL